MSEYMFGSGRGDVPAAKARKIDRIAQKHGAGFVNPTLPGDGPTAWFATRTRGEPFNGETARAVMADLEAAGLLPIVG